MEPQNAAFLRDYLVKALQGESRAIKEVVAAVPADKPDYAPSEKCMPSLTLAWHIASSTVWFLNSVADGEFKMEDHPMPAEIKSGADVSAWYEKEFPKAVERVQALSGEQLAKQTQFAIFPIAIVDGLTFGLSHAIHHRGQLSAYLRPMGSKVPSIYGPSADVSMEDIMAQMQKHTASA